MSVTRFNAWNELAEEVWDLNSEGKMVRGRLRQTAPINLKRRGTCYLINKKQLPAASAGTQYSAIWRAPVTPQQQGGEVGKKGIHLIRYLDYSRGKMRSTVVGYM